MVIIQIHIDNCVHGDARVFHSRLKKWRVYNANNRRRKYKKKAFFRRISLTQPCQFLSPFSLVLLWRDPYELVLLIYFTPRINELKIPF